MHDHFVPALVAIFVWWLGTGVVLYLDSLPAHTFRRSLIGAGIAFALSMAGLVVTAGHTEIVHSYLAFGCGVVLWGSLELTYFMGLVAGPRTAPCPPGCRGWRRFKLAIATSLYHELTVLAAGVGLALLVWDEPNRVGLWTFAVLWLMRWSAKLNIFLGVPNLNDDWLPEHLRFLCTYMSHRPMNHLFPVSVTAGTIVAVLLGVAAAEASATQADPFLAVGLTLVTTLLSLAVLEHWLLVLPLPDEALWVWAFKPRENEKPQETGAAVPTGRELQAQQS